MNNLSPKIVWDIFAQITQVPRPSKKEEKIRQYLRDFATKHSLPIAEDEIGNIVITRPAAEGYQDEATTILQSHVDMVCEKESNLEFDFETQPIETYVDGEWVKARGTTLGADCGIGMALQMAALTDTELRSGKIEALFTVDEEQGLTGAMKLGDGMLTGTRMINLDSEDEGEIYIGCAGGIDTIATFDAKLKKAPSAKNYDFYKLIVTGIRGGHSGDDINKGLANANKILIRELWEMMSLWDVKLCSIDGGNLRNAIARDAWSIVALPKEQVQQIILAAANLAADIKAEYAVTEPAMSITMEQTERPEYKIESETAHILIAALQATPHGVQSMSQTMPGLVETSTNLASIKIIDDEIVVTTSQRSAVESAKKDIAHTVESVFRLAGAVVRHTDGYPGWAPNPKSPLVERASITYEQMFGKKPIVKAIHAGLECGLLLSKYPEMDVISIGPSIYGAHSPAERIKIETVEMVWNYLKALLSVRH